MPDQFTQTDITKYESKLIEFTFSIEKAQEENGYKTIDAIQKEDFDSDNWAEMIVKQLHARDDIFSNLYTLFQKLITISTSTEEDLDYIKLKNYELNEQIKILKRKMKRKIKNQSNKSIQTEYNEEEWVEWYTNYWNSNNYNDTNYIHSQENTNTDKFDQFYKSPKTNNLREYPDSNSLSDLQDTTEIELEPKCTNNPEKSTNSDIDESLYNTESDSTPFDGQKFSENVLDKEEFSKDMPEGEEFSENMADKMEISENVLDIGKEKLPVVEECWKSDDIKKEVTQIANEIVSHSSYIYCEENGLYYDYSSGYYYNQENGLYYDPKSGTYFYYDHDTNDYVFHSQVEVQNSNQTDSKEMDFAEKPDSEKEEGECSDSDNEIISQFDDVYVNSPKPSIHDIAPSLRLMILGNGDGENITKGSLHIVTMDGGTIGRESQNLVHLPDISISKVHAEIIYQSAGEGDHHYFIKDLGSNNGTFVNKKRISDTRIISEPVEIGHGWKIKVGEIILGCHIHPGILTCNECEPGLQTVPQKSIQHKTLTKKGKEKERKQKAKELRKKYGLEWRDEQPSVLSSPNYKDRAEERRETVGSDNPYEKTEVASENVPINKKNKGFNLLKKMGWEEGQTIGKSQTGISDPIVAVGVIGRTGLGNTTPIENTTTKEGNKRKKIRQITKRRYDATFSSQK